MDLGCQPIGLSAAGMVVAMVLLSHFELVLGPPVIYVLCTLFTYSSCTMRPRTKPAALLIYSPNLARVISGMNYIS